MVSSGAEVFLSYRRRDSAAAGRLTDWLGSHFGGDRIFMDVTGIAGGEEFPSVIVDAIRNARVVLAVITPGWAADLGARDDWVRRELREALAAGRPIVPVLLHGVQPPARSELPAELGALADKQAIVVSDADFRDDVGRLIETLERLGVEPATLGAFHGIPRGSARTETRAAWDAADDAEHARERLAAALTGRGIRITGEHDGDLLLAGGSRWKARLIGSLTGPESRLPLTGRLGIRDRGAAVAIEVLLAENWGPGVFGGVSGRYSSYFDKVIADLRRATSRR